MINIKIERRAFLWDHVYGLKIYVDGKRIGKISGDETKRFSIPEGSQEIYGKLNWAKTRSFALKTVTNETHLIFKPYKTNNLGVLLGISGYPLEIVEHHIEKKNYE
ncbi:MAG: hypothetical protein ABJN69_06000 [Hellea sp.]